jgi:hypothetical protein
MNFICRWYCPLLLYLSIPTLCIFAVLILKVIPSFLATFDGVAV